MGIIVISLSSGKMFSSKMFVEDKEFAEIKQNQIRLVVLICCCKSMIKTNNYKRLSITTNMNGK